MPRLEFFFDLVAGQGGHKLFSISCMCVCACVLCSSVLRVHVKLCFVSLAGPGFFRAQSSTSQIAELWNKTKLHYKTFHTQSRLQSLTWEMIRVDQKPPKLRAKGAETCHLVPCCFELAMDFHKHQRSTHSLTVRGLFVRLVHDHVCGAVRQCCVRQVPPVLQPPQGFVQGGLRRHVVEDEAEGAHGPGDVRGAV